MPHCSASAQTFEDLQQEVELLRQENQRLRLCPNFGIYTRAAIELSWASMDWRRLSVLYADIDDLKLMNTEHGCEGVNIRIRAAFSQIRSSEVVCVRWQHGDEIMFLAPTVEAATAANRIQSAFAEQGIFLTIAITRCICPDLQENVANAQFLVERSKKRRRKGLILSVG